MVLIDTVGMSQRDRMVAEQAAMLSAGGRVARLLLLNSTARADTLDDVVRAYRGPDLAGAIMTKVDEATGLGTVLDVLLRHELPLYYVANGQRVPEDLHLPNRPYLLHRSLKKADDDSAHHLDAVEAGLRLAASGQRLATTGRASVVDFHQDQAAGLRRMFVRAPARIVTFAGGAANCGTSTALLATALALAEAGERVALIDEHQGSGSACARLGLTTRFDLLQAVNRDAHALPRAPQRRRQSHRVCRRPAGGPGGRPDAHPDPGAGGTGGGAEERRRLDPGGCRRRPCRRLAACAPCRALGGGLERQPRCAHRRLHAHQARCVHGGRGRHRLVARRARTGLDGTRIYAQIAEVARAHLERVPEWLGELPAPAQWCQPAPWASSRNWTRAAVPWANGWRTGWPGPGRRAGPTAITRRRATGVGLLHGVGHEQTTTRAEGQRRCIPPQERWTRTNWSNSTRRWSSVSPTT